MDKTLPPLTPLTMPYFDGCKVGVLRLQQCAECQQFQWQDASGNGVIASFTVVRKEFLLLMRLPMWSR